MIWGHKTAAGMAVAVRGGAPPWIGWVYAVAAALLLVVCAYAAVGPSAWRAVADAPGREVISYTVRPGDTLWEFAADATPSGGDVNDTLDELMRLNHLDSVQLSVGQRIVVPAGDD